jgi:hypothetical protein
MEISVVVSLIMGLGLLVFAVIGVVFLSSARARPSQPGWRGPVPSSAPPPASAPTGIWNAEVLGSGLLGRLGGTLGSTFGELRLDDGVLSFVPDGQTTASWSYPCVDLYATKRSAVALNGADLTLRGPMGDLRCNVSTERINRMTRNPFKDLRERGYADQFMLALRAHGARLG